MHARGQNEAEDYCEPIGNSQSSTRKCDSELPNLVKRADTSSSTMCCGFRFKDSNREAREECARSRRQSRERPRTRSIGSFIPMKRSGRVVRSCAAVV